MAERAAGLAGRVVGRRGMIGAIRGPWPVSAWFGARDLRAPAREIVPGLVAACASRCGRRAADGSRDWGRREMSGSSGPGGSSDARKELLRRVRAALADRPAVTAIPRAYRRVTEPGADVTALFAERVSEYRATVHRATAGDLAGAVAGILAARGVRRLVVPQGIPDTWLAGSDVDRLGDDPPLASGALDQADGVITGCAVAIADTGTIVLDGGPGQGRRALSLLPDYHLCVVETERIVGTVPEALALLRPTRPLTWISGPSATSDIELNRIEGVHGPRTLDVVIIEHPAQG